MMKKNVMLILKIFEIRCLLSIYHILHTWWCSPNKARRFRRMSSAERFSLFRFRLCFWYSDPITTPSTTKMMKAATTTGDDAETDHFCCCCSIPLWPGAVPASWRARGNDGVGIVGNGLDCCWWFFVVMPLDAAVDDDGGELPGLFRVPWEGAAAGAKGGEGGVEAAFLETRPPGCGGDGTLWSPPVVTMRCCGPPVFVCTSDIIITNHRCFLLLLTRMVTRTGSLLCVRLDWLL